jgi:hypothetical protein
VCVACVGTAQGSSVRFEGPGFSIIYLRMCGVRYFDSLRLHELHLFPVVKSCIKRVSVCELRAATAPWGIRDRTNAVSCDIVREPC